MSPVDEMFRISSAVQFESLSCGIVHHMSFDMCARRTYDETWNPFRMFGEKHRKKRALLRR